MSDKCKNDLYRELARSQILDKDLFMMAIKDFTVSALICRSAHVGFLIARGNELHLHIDKAKFVKYSTWVLRRVIMPMLAKYGELITLSPVENDSFLLRVGFVKMGQVGAMHKLVLRNLKLKGVQSCQC